MNAMSSRRDCDVGPVIYLNDGARILQSSDHVIRKFVQEFARKNFLSYLNEIDAIIDRVSNGSEDRTFLIFEICRIYFARSDEAKVRMSAEAVHF